MSTSKELLFIFESFKNINKALFLYEYFSNISIHIIIYYYIFIHLVIYNIMMLLFGAVSYKAAAAAAGVICLFVYYLYGCV